MREGKEGGLEQRGRSDRKREGWSKEEGVEDNKGRGEGRREDWSKEEGVEHKMGRKGGRTGAQRRVWRTTREGGRD